jgi:3-dehydroquinate synthase
MKKISVSSSLHSYPIFIDDLLFNSRNAEIICSIQKCKSKKIAIIYDENCLPYLKEIENFLSNESISVLSFKFPSGESSKSFETIYPVLTWLIENGLERGSGIIALGGGVTGDAVGFIASIYLRGVPFFQMPTTLLSMVDSSVGGKVAVNHHLGKNLIGSFYPPLGIYINISFLKSLPEREFNSGLAECVKHALLDGIEAIDWLFQNYESIISRDKETLKHLIERNITVKASIVEKDEKESGIREYLNLGHTFAHALEKHFSYTDILLHGEAVSLGLIAALKLSIEFKKLNPDILLKTEELLKRFSLPVRMNNLPVESLISIMKRDKKVRDNSIHFVLLDSPGSPSSSSDIPKELILSAWNYLSK